MSWSRLRGALSVWVVVGWRMAMAMGAALLGFGAGDASAASTSAILGVQLGPQKTGRYGTVDVIEASGGLEFRITLDSSSLGTNADLHEFYFNLPDQFSGVRLRNSGCADGPCTAPFQLASGKPTRGGAGSRFDYRVSFGNGRGWKGNGTLQVATFRIEADSALPIPSPFDPSVTSRDLAVIFAAHASGSKHVAATIGSTSAMQVPEPGTAALFGFGLLGLTWVGRRRR